MTKPLNRDLRIRLVAAVEGGMSCRAAARRFRVGDATVICLLERYREPARRRHEPVRACRAGSDQ